MQAKGALIAGKTLRCCYYYYLVLLSLHPVPAIFEKEKRKLGATEKKMKGLLLWKSLQCIFTHSAVDSDCNQLCAVVCDFQFVHVSLSESFP